MCEKLNVMFNQTKEELHATTLTNLGTVKKVCVCDLSLCVVLTIQ